MDFWNLFFKGRNNEVVSLVGSGGKTHLMRIIAAHFRHDKKVFLSATVDIERIPEKELDFIDYAWQDDYSLIPDTDKGVYLLSGGLTNDNLLKGIKASEADSISKGFDISVIECDISRKRLFKAWRENEPDVPLSTTITFIVLDLTAIGKKVTSENIYNLDIFMDVSGKKLNDTIQEEDILKFFTGDDSILKRIPGRKIIFMNKAETFKLNNLAVSLSKRISKESPTETEAIFSGSFHKREYTRLFNGEEA